MLFSECFDGSFTKTHQHRWWPSLDRRWIHPGQNHPLGGLEFITKRSDSLSLSPKANDSGAVFVGMVRSGLPSLHAILEKSIDEYDTTSSEGEP
jgi:hypothetical protein